jgi:transcriptional regulator with XRE-family HTH domain
MLLDKDKLRNARKKNKITQAQLGRLVGKSTRTIARWEAGLTVPSEHFIRLLADAFGLPVTSISIFKSKAQLRPLVYEELTILDKVLMDWSTKTETEKQKQFVSIQNQLKILAFEKNGKTKECDFLESILNSIKIVIYKKDKSLKYTYVNRYFLAFFNLSEDLLVGYRDEDILNHTASMTALSKIEKEVKNTKQSIERECISIKPFMEAKRTATVSIEPLISEKQTFNGLVGIIRDTSHNDTANEKYFYLEMALNELEHAIWIIKSKPHRHYIYLNDSMQNLFQFPKNEFYKNPNKWQEALYEKDRNRIQSLIKKDASYFEYRIQGVDGSIKHLEHFIYKKVINNEELEFGVIKDRTQISHAPAILGEF